MLSKALGRRNAALGVDTELDLEARNLPQQ